MSLPTEPSDPQDSFTLTMMITLLATTLAAMLYLVPVQMAMWDLKGKSLGPGGVIIFVVVGVMWILLLIAMLGAINSGAYADLSQDRSVEYGLGTLSILAMATVSFFAFEPSLLPSLFTGLIRFGMRVFPAMTLVFLVQHIQTDWFAPSASKAIRITWFVGALASILMALPFWKLRFGRRIWDHIRVIPRRMLGARGRSPQYLALIENTDPVHGFKELLKFATPYYGRVVRDAANARARLNPDFIRELSKELQSGSPDNPLAALARLILTPAEQRLLAEPALASIREVTRQAVNLPGTPGFFERHFVSFLWIRLMKQVASRFPDEQSAFAKQIEVSRRALLSPKAVDQ